MYEFKTKILIYGNEIMTILPIFMTFTTKET